MFEKIWGSRVTPPGEEAKEHGFRERKERAQKAIEAGVLIDGRLGVREKMLADLPELAGENDPDLEVKIDELVAFANRFHENMSELGIELSVEDLKGFYVGRIQGFSDLYTNKVGNADFNRYEVYKDLHLSLRDYRDTGEFNSILKQIAGVEFLTVTAEETFGDDAVAS
ncbi:hypothetical protein KC845_01460 [Candidatus Kaiserbacteria bacterium]|nr:hypothetical protein [Candidatus Kaiserbacteria bacterium]